MAEKHSSDPHEYLFNMFAVELSAGESVREAIYELYVGNFEPRLQAGHRPSVALMASLFNLDSEEAIELAFRSNWFGKRFEDIYLVKGWLHMSLMYGSVFYLTTKVPTDLLLNTFEDLKKLGVTVEEQDRFHAAAQAAYPTSAQDDVVIESKTRHASDLDWKCRCGALNVGTATHCIKCKRSANAII